MPPKTEPIDPATGQYIEVLKTGACKSDLLGDTRPQPVDLTVVSPFDDVKEEAAESPQEEKAEGVGS